MSFPTRETIMIKFDGLFPIYAWLKPRFSLLQQIYFENKNDKYRIKKLSLTTDNKVNLNIVNFYRLDITT